MYDLSNNSNLKDLDFTEVDFNKFLTDLNIKIIKIEENYLEFDILNCHHSLANAIRRILISEIDSFAFHSLNIFENDSIFPDEYLANRIGLIPLYQNINPGLKYILNIKNDTNENINVLSDHIKDENLNSVDFIKKNVLICKLAPKKSLKIHMTIKKSNGKEHAKFSPVALCSYRLMPKIILKKDFYGDDAIKLKSLFSKNVIEILNNKAVVKNPRLESMSREILRHDEFKNFVFLKREKNWFCFQMETLTEDPLKILKNGIEKFISKCQLLINEILNQ